MVISVQVDEELAASLAGEARRTQRDSGTIIRQAIREHLMRQRQRPERWPEELRRHLRGETELAEIPPFESYRSELPPAKEIDL